MGRRRSPGWTLGAGGILCSGLARIRLGHKTTDSIRNRTLWIRRIRSYIVVSVTITRSRLGLNESFRLAQAISPWLGVSHDLRVSCDITAPHSAPPCEKLSRNYERDLPTVNFLPDHSPGQKNISKSAVARRRISYQISTLRTGDELGRL